MAGKRCTEFEKECRVNLVMELLSRFSKRSEILKYVKEETDWNLKVTQVDLYIREARDKLKELENPDELRGMIMTNFKNLYNKNFHYEEFRECRAILESIAKLCGVNAPTEHKVENTYNFENFLIENSKISSSETESESESENQNENH